MREPRVVRDDEADLGMDIGPSAVKKYVNIVFVDAM